MKKAWIYVGLTSLFELIWIYGFNIADQWWHWGIIVICFFFDLHFLAEACAGLPTGTVYAVFAGVGTIGTGLMDVFLFDESLSGAKIGFIIVIIAGVIGLNLADRAAEMKNREAK